MSKEKALRESLRIPTDAQKVLIFAETSHWDPNWLYTSEEYYDRFVQKQLDQAISGLMQEPRRIYSIECMFFLHMYWERNPQQREVIRKLVNERRLRLTSSAVTTADTLLPSPEAILRDFLLGQEWLRRNGMTQEPKLAYFSDSFGSSSALPSLLKAAGFEQTAITRIDGMYFPGFERNDPKKYPRPGSTAERMLKEERTLDFVWRDPSGAQVLCHWNAFSYGQGDLLAHRGFSRIYLFPLAIPDPSERNVARRIRQFSGKLEPYSLTPYLFCPIGFDFVQPIPDLVALLDRYNEKRYPSTGIWALNAGLDDYLDLVNCYRDRLPVLELDPNPYWTGFYSARPALKKRCHTLVNELLLAEKLSYLPDNSGEAKKLPGELEDAWWTAAVANHHDFITGTSPDRVVYDEQVPWLEEALYTSSKKIEQLSPENMAGSGLPQGGGLPDWSEDQGKVRVQTPFYTIVLAEEAGGSIVRAEDPNSESHILDGLSNDLINYKDSGGLWRMGYEFPGGIWRQRDRTSEQRAEFEILERNGGLEISWVSILGGSEILRAMWFQKDSPTIYFKLHGRAPKRHSVTVSFSTAINADEFLMDTTGGVVSRTCERIYSPTFWPFQHFLHIQDQDSGRGLALYQELPGAASLAPDGTLQVVALRNAPRERAYHFLPVSGNPAKGYERDNFTFVYGLEFTPGGDWIENKLADKAFARTLNPWADRTRAHLRQLARGEIQTDRTDVWVVANKPARRGKGRILRLYTLAAPHQGVALSSARQEIKEAYLCDARERDIQPLETDGGTVHVTLSGTITTIRLIGAT
ncbi:MAG: hypothetical protein PVH03_09925 [Chloroflexota bacterium]|jgi:hypothetical protein